VSLDLSGPIREALMGQGAITALLGDYAGEPAIFTRRPAPEGAPYPMIMVSPDVAITDQDFLTAQKPIVMRDVAIYGAQPDDYRDVESGAYLIRDFFHNNRFAITVPGYGVIDILCTGPIPAPTDDENHLGRVVTLTIQLSRL